MFTPRVRTKSDQTGYQTVYRHDSGNRTRGYSDLTQDYYTFQAAERHNDALVRRVAQLKGSDIFDASAWAERVGVVAEQDSIATPWKVPDNSYVVLMPTSLEGEDYTFNKIRKFINQTGRMSIEPRWMSGIQLSLENKWKGDEPAGTSYFCSQSWMGEEMLNDYNQKKAEQVFSVAGYYNTPPSPVDLKGNRYIGKPYWCAFSKEKTDAPVSPQSLPSVEEITTLYTLLSYKGKAQMSSRKIFCRDIVPGVCGPERVSVKITDNRIDLDSTPDLDAGAEVSYRIYRFGKDSVWD